MIAGRTNGALRFAFNTPRDVRGGGAEPCLPGGEPDTPLGAGFERGHHKFFAQPVTPWPFIPMD